MDGGRQSRRSTSAGPCPVRLNPATSRQPPASQSSMNFLRSSTGLVALQGILEVSTIRSDRTVNNQLRSYTRGGDRPMHELRVGQRGRDAAEGADVLELRRCGRRASTRTAGRGLEACACKDGKRPADLGRWRMDAARGTEPPDAPAPDCAAGARGPCRSHLRHASPESSPATVGNHSLVAGLRLPDSSCECLRWSLVSLRTTAVARVSTCRHQVLRAANLD